MPGKGIKDPTDPKGDTCDCIPEGGNWENERNERKSNTKDDDDSDEEEERKESFEEVQFKSNQPKDKGFISCS